MRYTAYVAGAFLLLFLAVGVGAAVGFVAGRQFGTTPIGSVGTGTPGGGKLETTGSAGTFEGTTAEPSSSSENSNDTADQASFFYRASDENSRGDYMYISDPSIDGDTRAVILAEPTQDQVGEGATTYEHNVGVWFEPARRKWAIFNQDRARVPTGSTFEVVVPRASQSFVHRANYLNTAGNYTYLDDQLTNGKSDAKLSVTQNWNPGGGTGVYNDHPVCTQYDGSLKQWAVYNKDGAPMPRGASFNIAVSAGSE